MARFRTMQKMRFKNYLKSEQGFKDKFFLNIPDERSFRSGGEKAVNYKRQLEDAYKMENLNNTFGATNKYTEHYFWWTNYKKVDVQVTMTES